MTMDADFWQMFAALLVGLIIASIVLAALWSYIFKDRP
jgi:FtsH-binding integral membrane protein